MVVFNSFKAIRKTQLHNSNCILWHLDPAPIIIACRHFIDATAHMYIFTNGTMGDFFSEIREIHLLKIGNKVLGKFCITILKFLSTFFTKEPSVATLSSKLILGAFISPCAVARAYKSILLTSNTDLSAFMWTLFR